MQGIPKTYYEDLVDFFLPGKNGMTKSVSTQTLFRTLVLGKPSFKNISTVDIRYLEYPLSQTFTLSNFLFGPFSVLINFPYKSVRHLELRCLELLLCRTIFLVLQPFSGCFLSPISNIRIRILNESYFSFQAFEF